VQKKETSDLENKLKKNNIGDRIDSSDNLDSLLRSYEPLNKERYDPYIDYRNKLGTLDENNNRRYEKIFINIDSRHRIKKSSLILGESFTLDANPLEFTQGSKNIFVNHSTHPFQENDRIVLTNVSTRVIKLYHTVSNPAIIFTNNSNYAIINANLILQIHQQYLQNQIILIRK
jgi:hypothetical protein